MLRDILLIIIAIPFFDFVAKANKWSEIYCNYSVKSVMSEDERKREFQACLNSVKYAFLCLANFILFFYISTS